MPIEITMPKKLTLLTTQSLISRIATHDLQPLDKNMTFDLTPTEWIDPSGMSMLFNLGMWLTEFQDTNISFRLNRAGTYGHRSAMAYLEDSGFFEVFFEEDYIINKNHKPRNTTLPIKAINVSSSIHWNEQTLRQWLQKCTGRYVEFSSIKVGVDEIFNNIRDHSHKNIGCVFGQYTPRNNRLVISLSDFGIGIPTAMRKKYGDFPDIDLVKMAFEEGVSTESSPGNRGAGLPNIVRCLTNNGVGTVRLVTNHAKIRIENGKITSALEIKDYYPGTFYEVEVNIDNPALFEGEEEEEFDWLQ
ncbi:ATP-binding protein [Enterococcus asini]|nr:ATP-binding protein [Enterococcus asini]